MFSKVNMILHICKQAFNANSRGTTDIEILYPAATILLDLTANETQVQEVATGMLEY